MCASKDCAIAPCSDNEVPQGIREFEMKHGRSAACESIETATIGLGSIDSSVSHTESSVLAEWSAYDDSADTFCELDDENDAGLQYINLKRNPERYTGYMGPSANRIWRAIYQENCFLDNPSSGDGADGRTGAESSDGYSQDQMAALLTNAAGSPMSSGPRDPVPMQEILGNMCIERRVFYRVISGLHSSISIHLTHQYFDKTLRQYVPNLEDFARRFGPTHTAGEGPSRLKNLYFTYLLLLRAVTKARSVWQAESFFTGNPTEDASVKAQIDQLVSTSLTCPSTFDERIMFAGDPAMARIMKAEFREHFRNVSRIMDCVGCDKCRLWGKIQTQGIATALKILFSAHLDEDDQAPLDSADLTPDVQDDPAAIKPQQQQQQHQQQQQQQQQHQKQQQTARRRLNLRRSEIVSLFNTLGRLSESLKAVEDFRLMTKDAFSIPSPVQGAETWMEMLV
ncbi:Ero1l, variant [Capsaspora owczarzaki ATCC 30864]|nr:Ero1l, variant [Capsaspora owczarzaki ATCC 30864]